MSRLVDLTVFSLGTGVAGLAGVMLALLGPVTPTVGQSYIVPAFLVVILGGLGSLVGTTIASLIAGLFSALVQIFVDVSVAQVLTAAVRHRLHSIPAAGRDCRSLARARG